MADPNNNNTQNNNPPEEQLPRKYRLAGPQVEPTAACWRTVPRLTRSEIKQLANCVPPFPTKRSILNRELEELRKLATLREDNSAIEGEFVPSGGPVPEDENDYRRRPLAFWLRTVRPQPLGAVVSNPEPEDVIQNGGELARYFEVRNL